MVEIQLVAVAIVKRRKGALCYKVSLQQCFSDTKMWKSSKSSISVLLFIHLLWAIFLIALVSMHRLD